MSNINDFGMPFTSISGDRQYSAEDFREFFRMLVNGGVVSEVQNELEVVPQATPDRSIIISKGAVLIRGAVRILEATDTLTMNENTSGSARIDRIVARLDIADRQIEFVVLQGTPGSGAPGLTRNSSIWEFSLAQVACANGFTAITTSEITDERENTDVCGYSSTFKGLEDQINAWMDQAVKTTSSPTFADATIDSKLLSTYLGYLNQAVKTTSSPTFSNASIAGYAIQSVLDTLTGRVNQGVKSSDSPTFADATIAGMLFSTYINQTVKTTSSPTFADATIASKLLSTYLGYLNQGVKSSDSPTFNNATIAGKLLSTYLGYLDQGVKSSDSPTFNNATIAGMLFSTYINQQLKTTNDVQFNSVSTASVGAGNTELYATNGSISVPVDMQAEIITARIPFNGTIRVSGVIDFNTATNIEIKIFRNEVEVDSINFSHLNGSPDSQSKDVSGWSAGDLVRFRAYSDSGAGSGTDLISEFKISVDRSIGLEKAIFYSSIYKETTNPIPN